MVEALTSQGSDLVLGTCNRWCQNVQNGQNTRFRCFRFRRFHISRILPTSDFGRFRLRRFRVLDVFGLRRFRFWTFSNKTFWKNTLFENVRNWNRLKSKTSKTETIWNWKRPKLKTSKTETIQNWKRLIHNIKYPKIRIRITCLRCFQIQKWVWKHLEQTIYERLKLKHL